MPHFFGESTGHELVDDGVRGRGLVGCISENAGINRSLEAAFEELDCVWNLSWYEDDVFCLMCSFIQKTMEGEFAGMSNLKDLRVIYLSLEEGNVLREWADDWSIEDTEEFGLDFQKILALRDFVLGQEWSVNLGFERLLEEIFPTEIRALLTSEELEIWNSVESSLDETRFALAMIDLISGDLENLREGLIDDWLLEELDSIEAAEAVTKEVNENFELWKSSDAPKALIELLPSLAARELSKLQELRE